MIILGFELLCIILLTVILSTIISEERKKQLNSIRPIRLMGYWDGNERRSVNRLNISLEVKYFLNGKFAHTKSIDISTKGIRLILDEKIKKGTVLRLEIKLPNYDNIIKLRGGVVWVKEVIKNGNETGKRLFNTGIKFLEPSETDEKRLFDFIRSLQLQKV